MILRWTCAATPGRVRGPATRAAVRGRDGERAATLNEGRGVNPGDMLSRAEVEPVFLDRRHEGWGVNPGDTAKIYGEGSHQHLRSTKAGA